MKTTINLQDELVKIKNKSKSLEDIDFDKITADLDFSHVKTQLSDMGFNEKVKQLEVVNIRKENGHKFDKENIFNLAEIHKICGQYGLTFLPTKFYKGEIDIKCHQKIEKLKLEYQYYFDCNKFHIAAPASSFVLQPKPIDPIMFYDLGHNNFLFIHKWGKDISRLRKLLFFPFRNAKTFCGLLFPLSFILGLSITYFSPLHSTIKHPFEALIVSIMFTVGIMIFVTIITESIAEKINPGPRTLLNDGL